VEACCQDLEWLVINAIGKDGRDELERAMDLEPDAWVHGVGYVTGAWFAFGKTVVHADNNDQRGGLTYVAPLGEKTGQMIVRSRNRCSTAPPPLLLYCHVHTTNIVVLS
jgi:hypothetical protein